MKSNCKGLVDLAWAFLFTQAVCDTVLSVTSMERICVHMLWSWVRRWRFSKYIPSFWASVQCSKHWVRWLPCAGRPWWIRQSLYPSCSQLMLACLSPQPTYVSKMMSTLLIIALLLNFLNLICPMTQTPGHRWLDHRWTHGQGWANQSNSLLGMGIKTLECWIQLGMVDT